jgi:hypothetical protein
MLWRKRVNNHTTVPDSEMQMREFSQPRQSHVAKHLPSLY